MRRQVGTTRIVTVAPKKRFCLGLEGTVSSPIRRVLNRPRTPFCVLTTRIPLITINQ